MLFIKEWKVPGGFMKVAVIMEGRRCSLEYFILKSFPCKYKLPESWVLFLPHNTKEIKD